MRASVNHVSDYTAVLQRTVADSSFAFVFLRIVLLRTFLRTVFLRTSFCGQCFAESFIADCFFFAESFCGQFQFCGQCLADSCFFLRTPVRAFC